MLTKRIALISAHKPFQRRALAGLMAAGASVDVFTNLAEFVNAKLKVHLVLFQFSDDIDKSVREFHKLGTKLSENVGIVAVVPKADLELVVELMQQPACMNVLVESETDAGVLAGVASRHLYGDIFGIEKHLPWGVRVYSMLVGDYQEKSVAIATISEFAAAMGVRRKYLEQIERVVDELLMNALYDAPVDEEGQPVFEKVSTRDRLGMRLEQKALLQYGCDGERFVVAVRDHYGTLEKKVILRYLDKCLHAEQQIDRKEGGAGLGLYIVMNSVTKYSVNLQPGVATEAVCTFDLKAPKQVLHQFNVFQEKVDSLGRLAGATTPTRSVAAAGRSRRSAAPMPLALKLALGGAVVLLMAAVGVLLYTQLKPVAKGSLIVKTDPPGAAIAVDGASRGVTSPQGLRVSDLRADRPHLVRAEKEGYEAAETLLRVTKGKASEYVFQLEALSSRLVVRSQPGGARVLVDGKDTGQLTPASLKLPPNRTVLLGIRKDDYEPYEKKIQTPAPGKSLEVPVVILKPSSDWATVRVLSRPPGARVFVNGVMQQGRTPVEHLAITAGRPMTIELRLDGYVPWKTTVELAAQASTTLRAVLEPAGYLNLTTKPACDVVIDGKDRLRTPLRRQPLAVGTHRLLLRSNRPYISKVLNVKLTHKALVDKTLVFGVVTVAGPQYRIDVGGRLTSRVGLMPGTRRIVVVNRETKERKIKRVTVLAGRTVTVQW